MRNTQERTVVTYPDAHANMLHYRELADQLIIRRDAIVQALESATNDIYGANLESDSSEGLSKASYITAKDNWIDEFHRIMRMFESFRRQLNINISHARREELLWQGRIGVTHIEIIR